MNAEELSEKMDELGQLLYDIEEAERQFQMEHSAEYARIADLKDELWQEVITQKRPLQSEKLKVTYHPEREIWDHRALFRYAKEHPEILQLRRSQKQAVTFSWNDSNLAFDND